jgi:hypothetical protein
MMLDSKKFQNNLHCVCKNNIVFEIIPEIECEWGIHTVIQCPNCEELFSIDKKCPAFETMEKLWKNNIELYDEEEQLSYLEKSHSP